MPYDDYNLIEITVEDQVALLAMNQPERLNPVSPNNVEVEIRDGLIELENDTSVRAVVFTGKGRSFSAGADIRPGGPAPDPRVATMEGSGSQLGRFLYGAIPGGPGIAGGSMWQYLHQFRKPLIGAVKGYALGGGWELAEACDLIVAGESAQFGSIEVKLGLYPFGIGSQYLARTIGKHRALWMMMTGNLIDAGTALDWGLVNEVVSDEECLSRAFQLAREIIQFPPLALSTMKYMVNKAMRFDEHYDLERALAYHLQQTEDTKALRDSYVGRTGKAVEYKNR
ncbi:MAG: enoyl-CoA hydratase/isomerase family protein [Acidimicrobiales bacterium]|nr:enoyl-CoA hydratase/isomerase family protein [Acidimicrobiales bacterium]